MEYLLDILNTDNEFCAKASAEINAVINMRKLRQKSEFINNKENIAFVSSSGKRFLNCEIEQQLINRAKYTTDRKVVFDKYHFAAFLPDKLTHGQGAPLGKVAYQHVRSALLQFA